MARPTRENRRNNDESNDEEPKSCLSSPRTIIIIIMIILVSAFVAVGASVLHIFKWNPFKIGDDESLLSYGNKNLTNSETFLQTYSGSGVMELSAKQISQFESNVKDLTSVYGEGLGGGYPFVMTKCKIRAQTLAYSQVRQEGNETRHLLLRNTSSSSRRRRQSEHHSLHSSSSSRNQKVVAHLEVFFTMSYSSKVTNVAEYPLRFLDYMNSAEGSTNTFNILQRIGLSLIYVSELTKTELPPDSNESVVPTNSPTISPISSPSSESPQMEYDSSLPKTEGDTRRI